MFTAAANPTIAAAANVAGPTAAANEPAIPVITPDTVPPAVEIPVSEPITPLKVFASPTFELI